MQRNRGLSICFHLYGEPAKTLRRFCLRRRSQRSPLWLKEFKIQVQSSAALTFVTTRPFESKLSWRSLLQKFKVQCYKASSRSPLCPLPSMNACAQRHSCGSPYFQFMTTRGHVFVTLHSMLNS